MPESQKTGRKNRKRRQFVCCMCGGSFFAAREGAVTESNRCRSALRRWRALYGAAPVNPPGANNLRPAYWNKEAFLRAYVNLPAYEQHKKAKRKKR